MQKQYKRLSFSEREEISRGLAQGASFREIARTLKRKPSTISREVWRSVGKGVPEYRAHIASARTEKRRLKQAPKRKLDINEKLKNFIIDRLNEFWSPEQIASYLEVVYPNDKSMRISKETIYRYIYVLPKGELKRTLIKALRREHRWRRKRNRKKTRSTNAIPGLVSIHQRPREAIGRKIPGHWEGDLLLGKWRKSALGTLVERKSRYVSLVPLPAGYSHIEVGKRFEQIFSRLPESLRQTLTYDRGPEMASHQKLTRKTKVKVFFCDPQSPWQRGSNENTNGLIRQFFPKGTDFSKLNYREIRYVEKLLNDRPRKVLDYRKPKELFQEMLR